MLNLPRIFLTIADRVSGAMGAPFFDGLILSETAPVYDDGGSIVTPGMAVQRACRVQIDAVDETMRPDGWTDKDYNFIILAASFTGSLDTDARVSIPTGPRAGIWAVSSLTMDPASIGYAGRGRRE